MVRATNYVSGHLARRFGVLTLLIVSILWSCNDDFKPVKTDYYPVEENARRIYKVTENIYAVNAEPIKKTYYLKEQIINVSQSGEGTEFLISRNISTTISGDYQSESVFKGSRNPNLLMIKEGNIDFVKMIFPVSDGLTFNPNKYNSLPEESSKCQITESTFSISGFSSGSLLAVIEKNDSSLIDRKLKYARYANGIGMIEFRDRDLEYCQVTPECIGKGIISSGKDIKYELVSLVPGK